MTSRPDDHIAQAIRVQRDLGMKGDNWDNHAVARGTLYGDLGYEGSNQSFYDLDEPTRDRLLAHARQDAAHALCNTTSLLKRLRSVERLMYVSILANVVLLIAVLSARS
ncbi:hypothetical protein ABEV34_21525 [Methylorubrum rhodesianum]|uniref:hypothetical protein n=1 Tax=Methylorubrum rhodesianum TaxID=29427 RepID=UPI003D27EACF